MLLPEEVKSQALLLIASQFAQPVKMLRTETIGGGSINHSFKFNTSHGNFFLKWNFSKKYPLMFAAEAKGLALLRSKNIIYVPEVIAQQESGLFSFILLEWVDAQKAADDFHEHFGICLAKLHRNTLTNFGLDYDNYIGSLPQSNTQHTTWQEFFILERVEPQLKAARNNNLIPRETGKNFENLFKSLNEIFPSEPPALLHGDLWSGNYLKNHEGKAPHL